MADSSDSWFIFNSQPAGPQRSTRVKLLGSVLAMVHLGNRHLRARLHQLSTSGGVLQASEPFEEAAQVDLIFHIGSTNVRAGAEMLPAMWSTQGFLQPFRFVTMSEEDRRRLGRALGKLLAGNKLVTRTSAKSSHFPHFPPMSDT